MLRSEPTIVIVFIIVANDDIIVVLRLCLRRLLLRCRASCKRHAAQTNKLAYAACSFEKSSSNALMMCGHAAPGLMRVLLRPGHTLGDGGWQRGRIHLQQPTQRENAQAPVVQAANVSLAHCGCASHPENTEMLLNHMARKRLPSPSPAASPQQHAHALHNTPSPNLSSAWNSWAGL